MRLRVSKYGSVIAFHYSTNEGAYWTLHRLFTLRNPVAEMACGFLAQVIKVSERHHFFAVFFLCSHPPPCFFAYADNLATAHPIVVITRPLLPLRRSHWLLNHFLYHRHRSAKHALLSSPTSYLPKLHLRIRAMGNDTFVMGVLANMYVALQ